MLIPSLAHTPITPSMLEQKDPQSEVRSSLAEIHQSILRLAIQESIRAEYQERRSTYRRYSETTLLINQIPKDHSRMIKI